MNSVEIVPSLYVAFSFLNAQLFSGRLPSVVITLHRQHNALGYFSPESYVARQEPKAEHAHEIALNPDTFKEGTDEEIISTLAHEMVHLQQQEQGKPGRKGYHNKEWAAMMEEVGLKPFNVDAPEKKTGQKCSHTIVINGRFAKTFQALKATDFCLAWDGNPKPAISRPASKIKYECKDCGINAWGKPELKLVCGICGQFLEQVE